MYNDFSNRSYVRLQFTNKISRQLVLRFRPKIKQLLLATAKHHNGLFLSNLFLSAKSCKNQLSNQATVKQLLGSFSKISLATPGSDEKSSCM